MASKNKIKEKAGTTATTTNSTVKSPPNIEIDACQTDLLPVKITEDEWRDLISVDEGVEIVLGLLDEVVDRAAVVLYDHYLDKEIFPYSVREAKKTILKIIAFEFVARDEGEKDTENDPSWQCSQPPVPAPIDSWARGVIPLSSTEDLHSLMDALEPIQVHQPVLLEEATTTTPTITTEPRSTTRVSTGSATSSVTSKAHSVKRKARDSVSKTTRSCCRHQAQLVPLEHPPEKVTEVRKSVGGASRQSLSPANAITGPTPSPSPSESDQPIITPFGMRPSQLSWMKDVKYDKKGKIVHMKKLDPAKFPHSTKPEVSIIYNPKDPTKQGYTKQRAKFTSLPPNPHHHLPATKGRGGRAVKAFSLQPHHTHQEDEGGVAEGERERREYVGRDTTVMPSDAGLTKKESSKRFPSIPALPSLVDTIDPLPGVTVRDGKRSVQGPTPHFRPNVSPGLPLRPVKPLEERERGVVKDGTAQKQYRRSQVAS